MMQNTMMFELTTPSGLRLGIVRSIVGSFWVMQYDESLPNGWRWRAIEYPPYKTLELAKERLYELGCAADAPSWLVGPWRAKVDEAIGGCT